MNQKNKDPLGSKEPTVLTKDQMRRQIQQALAASRGELPRQTAISGQQAIRYTREPEPAVVSGKQAQQRQQMQKQIKRPNPQRSVASAPNRTVSQKAVSRSRSGDAAAQKKSPQRTDTASVSTFSSVAARTSIITGICLIALLLLVYFAGLIYCNQKFLPNTYINDINVGGMTEQEAEQAIIQNGESIRLTFITKDKQEIPFSGASFGCTVSLPENILDPALNESHSTWFTKLFHKTYYTVTLDNSYSENDLRSLVAAYSWGDTPATDAHIEKNSDGSYEIIPEDDGNMVDTSILADYTVEQLRSGNQKIDIAASGAYLTANVKKEDLTETLELYNTIGMLEITFDMTDRQAFMDPVGTEVLDADTMADWISCENGEITVDETAAENWVTENIANKYDTYVTGYSRTFDSTLDGTIELPLGSTGIYGWKTDIQATTQSLITCIKNGEAVTIEPEYKQAGARPSVIGSDNTYIEVDICHQHLWFYVNGELYLESDVVTGLTTPDRYTPTGAFKVWSKEKGRYLGTMEVQGYHTWVDYWMPIDHTGIGLHDLNRSAYGGEIYKTNGSHGCVNLPLDVAASIYEKVTVGTPVLVIP